MSRPDDAIQAYLDSLTAKAQAELAAAVKQEAEDLSEAQRTALRPLITGESDGNLEASCVAVPGEHDGEYVVQAGGEKTTKEIRKGSGVAYDYAAAFEYGTTRQAARPFFWPTYRERRDGIRERLSKAIERILR